MYIIWLHERLKVPAKHPKRARLWRADGSCLRLWPLYCNHVWPFDFVAERMRNSWPFRIFNILDEYTLECLASVVARRIRSHDVLSSLPDQFLSRGIPTHIRLDNGPEFIARKLRHWLNALKVAPLFSLGIPVSNSLDHMTFDPSVVGPTMPSSR